MFEDNIETYRPTNRPLCQCGSKTSFGCGNKCRVCFYSDEFFSKKIETHLKEANVPSKSARQAAQNARHFKKNKKLYPSTLLPETLNTSLFLPGKAGIGKTTFAVECMIYHMEYFNSREGFLKGRNFLFETTQELIQKLCQSFKLPYQEEVELLDKYKNVDFLILDDFGVEKASDWAFSVLYLIINHRYEEDKQTIFTSNYSLDQLTKKFNDERITRRINDWCRIIELTR